MLPVSLQALLRAIELNGVAIDCNKQAFAWGRIAAADPDGLAEAGRVSATETLDEVIGRRAAFLTDYQDTAYAEHYRSAVSKVRRAEARLSSETLTDAVARSLLKLMAYKDEYEVARLHMQTDFVDALEREFEGNFRIHYHLAPPFLPTKRDARGRPRKRAFGQWIQTPLSALARLRSLRGTTFDPFGYTAERRQERELIVWYERLIAKLLAGLDAGRLPDLVAIAKAPMEIRGYGPVKDAAVRKVKAEVDGRLDTLAAPLPPRS